MSILTKQVKTVDKLVDVVGEYSNDRNYLWRGQRCYSWKLQTSLNRFLPLKGRNDTSLEDYVNSFIIGQEKIADMKFDPDDRMSWLEYGQYSGLPTPCLSFTASPYIGLFFAISGINTDGNEKSCALYAINIKTLATYYVTEILGKNRDSDDWWTWYNTFMNPPVDDRFNYCLKKNPIAGSVKHPFFDEGKTYPYNKLQFFSFPRHSRMLRQQGCFIYDTLSYRDKTNGFESLVSNIPESYEDDGPSAVKIGFPVKKVDEAFRLLEKMNINASLLYMDSRGVAEDVKNAYYHTLIEGRT